MEAHRENRAGQAVNRAPLRSGELVGGFRIIRVNANDANGFTYIAEPAVDRRGGMGEAAEKVTLREYAPSQFAQRTDGNIKPLAMDGCDAALSEGMASFRHATETATAIDKPALVPVYGLVEDRGTAYRVAGVAIGTSYHELVQRGGAIDTSDVSRLLAQLLPALFALERAELFHGEISPSTLIYGRDRSSRLLPSTDYRPSYRASPANGPRSFETPFMPPETLSTDGVNYGVTSELYSVAATCLYLLTGEVPPPARERLAGPGDALDMGRLYATYPDASTLLSQLAPSLALDPSLRPKSIRALIKRLLEAQAPGANAPSSQDSPPPPIPQHNLPSDGMSRTRYAAFPAAPPAPANDTVNRLTDPLQGPLPQPRAPGTPLAMRDQASLLRELAGQPPRLGAPHSQPPVSPVDEADVRGDETVNRAEPPTRSADQEAAARSVEATLRQRAAEARLWLPTLQGVRLSPLGGAVIVFLVISASVLTLLGRGGEPGRQNAPASTGTDAPTTDDQRLQALLEREAARMPQRPDRPIISAKPETAIEAPTPSATASADPFDEAPPSEPDNTAVGGADLRTDSVDAAPIDPAEEAASAAWAVVDEDDPDEVRAWLADHRGTSAEAEARETLRTLDDEAWLAALADGSDSGFRLYLDRFGSEQTPPGKHAASAESQITQIENETALLEARAVTLFRALGAFPREGDVSSNEIRAAVMMFQELVGQERTGQPTPELIAAMEASLSERAEATRRDPLPEDKPRDESEALSPEMLATLSALDQLAGTDTRQVDGSTSPRGPAVAETDTAVLADRAAAVDTPPPSANAAPEPDARAIAPRAEPKAVGDVFMDCEACPQMRVLPAGEFTMGSRRRERGRFDNEGPRKTVRIMAPIAVGTKEVSRDEFAAYLAATGAAEPAGCYVEDADGRGNWVFDAEAGFSNPGFQQTGSHPAVCVSWQDAQGYVSWMSETTGRPYRLLSEAEWEYVARAGTSRARFWAGDLDGICNWANGADAAAAAVRELWVTVDCDDGHVFTAPGGAYGANDFGLRDTIGNVWEWVEDCFADTLAATPDDGTANTRSGCASRVIRGGSWASSPDQLRASKRSGDGPVLRYNMLGFRVAAAPRGTVE